MHLASKRAEAGTSTLIQAALAGGSIINPTSMEVTVVTDTTPADVPAIDRAKFVEPSPYDTDAGNLIGRDPRRIPLAEIRQLRHPESPVKAIRAKCIECSGGNAAEARKCTAVNCALWPMRMGVSPFHASSASAKLDAANFAASGEEEAI